MGFIFLVLIIGALIAAIWGRSVAKGFVVVVLGGAAILLGCLVLFIGVLLLTVPRTDMSHAHGAWDTPPPGRSAFTSSGTNSPAAASGTDGVPAALQSPATAAPAVLAPSVPAVPAPVTIVRLRVGIITRDLTSSEDGAIGLRPGVGQCVTSVAPGSGAAAGNVLPGDQITKVYVHGTWYWVATQGDITQAVEASPAGSVTWMEMLRYGRVYRVGLRSAAYVVGSR